MADEQYLAIEDNSGTEDVFDINYLKSEAIDELQRLTGKEWTDYNIHDPGITTIEIICFAFTELAYRTDYGIQDLFHKEGKSASLNDTFFSAEKILTSGIITSNDIKRQLLDFEEIKNIEIRPCEDIHEFKGLFDVYVELGNIDLPTLAKDVIEEQLLTLLNVKRVLGTGVNRIIFLESDPIKINLTIELSGKVDPTELLRTIAFGIENYFSPNPEFQGLEELRTNGVPVEDIYSGPLLKNGFISDKSLSNLKVKKFVLISDLINVIMDVDKVVYVSEIELRDSDTKAYNWIYNVKEGKVPRLNFEDSKLTVTYKGKESFSIDFSELSSDKLNFGSKLSNSFKKNILSSPTGTQRDFLSYRSIQLDFPKLFGVGDSGLPVGADEANKAHVKQFKGYLTFFDQIFANYFAQLNHLKDLFSLNDLKTTSASQLLADIPGAHWLYKPFMDEYFTLSHDSMDENLVKKAWKTYLAKHKESIEENLSKAIEDRHTFLERRNRILDHLLSRFGYDLTSFEFVSQLNQVELIEHKINLLKNLEELGKIKLNGISSSSDFFEPIEKQSGYLKYLYKILGLRGGGTTKLSDEIVDILNEGDGNGESANFEIEGESFSSVLAQLLLLGSKKNNFLPRDNSIDLLSDEGAVLGSVSIKSADKELYIDRLVGQVSKLNASSEGFYLIEHLLLKPTDEMKVFGFHVQLKDMVIFESSFNDTRSERDNKIADFATTCEDESKFEIKEISINQYKIVWRGNNTELEGCYYFESIEEAQESLKNYILYFSDLENLDSCIIRSTKFKDFYNELSDPFSNIITYILPTWPARFQNSAFKKYIEEVLLAETPAHIYANIIWMDYERIKGFEIQYQNWIDTAENESSSHEQALSELLPYLVK